ncbi:uncharacterized protein [Nicotiana tomentosiformis]|uniref:uncharacterized protein n=1 Tax=Nicotiana tomentosiformis TaxID=4098 RepID=UPI00388C4B72
MVSKDPIGFQHEFGKINSCWMVEDKSLVKFFVIEPFDYFDPYLQVYDMELPKSIAKLDPLNKRIQGDDVPLVIKSKYGSYQKIGECEVVDFLWENIIYRFGIPKEIACDNVPQFIGAKVTKFLEDLKIKRITSSPYHPSANGQADLKNKVIIQNLKKRLEAANGKWPEEFFVVLWAYRTMAKSSTGETPFFLVCGVEALIPVEVGEPTLRYSQTNEESNNEAMLINLELLEGCRDLPHVRMVAHKQRMERYYNRRANFCFFKVGDLVLRKVT